MSRQTRINAIPSLDVEPDDIQGMTVADIADEDLEEAENTEIADLSLERLANELGSVISVDSTLLNTRDEDSPTTLGLELNVRVEGRLDTDRLHPLGLDAKIVKFDKNRVFAGPL